MNIRRNIAIFISAVLVITFLYMFSGCSISLGAYRVSHFGFLNYSPNGTVHNISSRFQQVFNVEEDDKIIIFLSLLYKFIDNPVYVKIKLYDPNGNFKQEWTRKYIGSSSKYEGGKYNIVYVSTKDISKIPGKWVVKAYVDEQKIGSESFKLIVPPNTVARNEQSQNSKQVWTKEPTPLRLRPSVEAKIGEMIQVGVALNSYHYKKGWYFVPGSKGWGWIEEKYISTTAPDTSSKTTTSSTSSSSDNVQKETAILKPQKVWTKNATPLRARRDVSATTKEMIAAGTELKVFSSEPGWYFVLGSREMGWIEEKYVSTTVPNTPSLANPTYKLTVQATPVDSTIRIMNIDQTYRPGIELKPGQYDILVEQEGYKQVRQQITIQNSDVLIPVTLQRLVHHPATDIQQDKTPPHMVIREPILRSDQARLTLNQSLLTVRGQATDASGISSIMVNGKEASVSPQGEFWAQVPLVYGENSIRIRAADPHDNIEEKAFTVVRGTTPPSPRVGFRPVRRRFALVIGNSNYDVGRLPNPVNDATDVAAMLRELGFSVTLIRDAIQQDMEDAIDSFTRKLGEGDAGLFFFAGHGIQVNGQNYLIPTDARITKETDVKYRAVSANWLLDNMENAGNALNIVILDACRDNPYARSWRSTQRGLAGVSAVDGALIAYATAPGQTAADGTGRNSPYTKHLLRFLPQPNLKVEELFKQVRIAVRQETRNKQTPWEASSLIGDFYFAGKTP